MALDELMMWPPPGEALSMHSFTAASTSEVEASERIYAQSMLPINHNLSP
jgi:hypothetical protein